MKSATSNGRVRPACTSRAGVAVTRYARSPNCSTCRPPAASASSVASSRSRFFGPHFERVRDQQRLGRRMRARVRDELLEDDALVRGVLVDQHDRVAVGREDERAVDLRQHAQRLCSPSPPSSLAGEQLRRPSPPCTASVRAAARRDGGANEIARSSRSAAPRRSALADRVLHDRRRRGRRAAIARRSWSGARSDRPRRAARADTARRTDGVRPSRTCGTPPTTRRSPACCAAAVR